MSVAILACLDSVFGAFRAGLNKDFKADIDWIFNPNNFVKILEEKYSTKELNVTKYNKGSEEFI